MSPTLVVDIMHEISPREILNRYISRKELVIGPSAIISEVEWVNLILSDIELGAQF